MDEHDTSPSYHMTPDEFRARGREVVDWIADYMERVESYPVLSTVAPGAVREQLPPDPPEHPEPWDVILGDLESIVMPGITHWQSPSFFAYFPSNTSGPSILGDLVSAGLGVQGMLWSTSPACTEVESHVLDWLADMLGLPEAFTTRGGGGGVIHDTASSSSLCALLAARERATGWSGEARPAGTPPLVAYASVHTHSWIQKAVRIIGLGDRALRLVEADDEHALRPERLRKMMAEDRAAGRRPFFVAATLGTTSSNAFDPLPETVEGCREHDAWLHVDAAMSGTAFVCPEFRHLQAGVEGADSYCFNPHKWMFTNFDCNAFWVRDPDELVRSLAVMPEYLRNEATASGRVIDYRDWQIPLGRRFRALKLWFVIRHYGVEGIRHHVRRHVELARELAERVEAHPDFELAAPVPLNLVCFRHRGGDDANQGLMDALNRSGELFLTHTRLDDRFTLRLCVGQAGTEARHVAAAWTAIEREAERLSGSG